jgi:hypothetical protein
MAAGMIGRAIHDAGMAWQEASAATAQGVKITVNEHNIVKAAAIIEAEAQRFQKEITAIADDLYVKPMGGDPVSAEAARVLTEKFQKGEGSYVGRCEQRVQMLAELANQLKEAAKTYGFTEDEVKSQFSTALQDALTDETPRRGAWRDI